MTSHRLGDFELLRRVGRDGPFVLFRAQQLSLGRLVTLKVLPGRTRTLERIELLRREAEAADRLDHPGIVRVFEVGEAGGTPYLAQAPVEGERLVERLKAGVIRPRLAFDLIRQLAEAIAHAHERNVLHGSLRPEVVWLTRDGQARLAGFGCPALFEEMDAEGMAEWAGYLAPEQSGGRGAVGRASDVYGLGALLYAMATGGPPHRSPTVAETCRLIRSRPAMRPSRLHPSIPAELDQICRKCLSAEPSHRYGQERPLARLINDLRRVGSGRPQSSGLDDWLRRRARLLRAVALLLIFAALPAGWDWQRHRSAWDTLTNPEAPATQHQRAARHFERLANEEPFSPEAIAGRNLGRCRTGQAPVAPPLWSNVASEWDAVRALTEVLVAAKNGRRAEATAALESARRANYVPKTEAERRLLAECEQALAKQ